MGRRVGQRLDEVVAPPDDTPLADDHRPDRHFLLVERFAGLA